MRWVNVKYSKIIVAFIIIANTLFSIACLYIFYKTHVEPVGLIAAWFAFTTGELWAMASIRKKKAENEKCNTEVHYENDYEETV